MLYSALIWVADRHLLGYMSFTALECPQSPAHAYIFGAS